MTSTVQIMQKCSFPLQTEEQSRNTALFLQLVADTYDTGYCCAIMEQHRCKKTSYKRYRDAAGKLQYALDGAGERVPKKVAGVDWTSPALCERLYGGHSALQKLLEILTSAGTDQKILFVPGLVTARSLMQDYKVVSDTVNGKKLVACNKQQELDEYYAYIQAALAAGHRRFKRKPVIKTKYDAYNSSDVKAARCLWVDIDGHGEDVTAEMTQNAVNRLSEVIYGYCGATGMPVPAIVSTGRGVHLYWWFSDAVDLDTEEKKQAFKGLLMAAGRWAADMIQWDPTMTAAWESDGAVGSVFHLMHLPGTINQHTGTARYVVNEYGVDYYKYAFEDICAAMAEYIGIERKAPKNCIQVQAGDAVTVVVTENFARKPYATGRLARLLRWADGRSWDIPNKREIFLFLCGCMIQQQADGTIKSATHPLSEINQSLKEPLDASEVQKIVHELNQKANNGSDPYTKWYLYKSETMIELLDMSVAEARLFKGSSTRYGTYKAPKTPNFGAKLAEIMAAGTLEEGEDPEEYKQRCYRQTVAFFDEFRKVHKGFDTHAARNKKRAEAAASRKEKDIQDAEKCRELQAQGLSIRLIAAELGLSKSKVQRLLHTCLA